MWCGRSRRKSRPWRFRVRHVAFACVAGASICIRTHGPARAQARKALTKTVDAVTGAVENTAVAVGEVGDATAATLGATVRLTGGLLRGLGNAVKTVGEAQVVQHGPLAAPSRVYFGVYRIAGALLTGVGNATIGLGGTVEGLVSEASQVIEDSVKIVGEPTRLIGNALRKSSRRDRRSAVSLSGMEHQLPIQPDSKRPLSSFERSASRQSKSFGERIVRRCLTDAFGNPSDRMVSLTPLLALALLCAWLLGRRSCLCGAAFSFRSSPWLLLRCCTSSPLNVAGLVVILCLVLRMDQRHGRIMNGVAGIDGDETVHWLNDAVAAIWSPLREASDGGGLGAELAMYTAEYLDGDGDVLAFGVERVMFGDTPPVFDAVRTPEERIALMLTERLRKARASATGNSSVCDVPHCKLVFLEADVGWKVDSGFEISMRASTASTVNSSLASRYMPQLKIKFSDVTLGPAPVAIALEAAPQGYPYVGLVALTFMDDPQVEFSVTPPVPLVREAIAEAFGNALPLAAQEEVLVFDLGEWLAPGLFHFGPLVVVPESSGPQAGTIPTRRTIVNRTKALLSRIRSGLHWRKGERDSSRKASNSREWRVPRNSEEALLKAMDAVPGPDDQ